MITDASTLATKRIALWLATGLGLGRSPWAPGTFGSVWGVPLTLAILLLPHLLWQIVAIALLCLIGVPICGSAAKQLGLKDPGCIVWDEFAALPIVFLGLSAADARRPVMILVGFVLFRVFDISKLPPVRFLERFPDGWGIMADDIAAALYALLALSVLRWTLPAMTLSG